MAPVAQPMAAPAAADEADEPVTLLLTRRQVEKLTAWALRQLVQGDSQALADRLPTLIDLAGGE
jgi:hypothetical protein